MQAELVKVETTISAINSGNLEPHSWSHSHVLALGLSGQRNPLGSAVLHLIENPNNENHRTVLFFLSGELERREIATHTDSVTVARQAMNWFQNCHCPVCKGRGVLNFEQEQCKECSGTGDKHPHSNNAIRDAVSLLTESLNWLENQQRARLSRA